MTNAANNLSDGALALFLAYAEDADNWSGMPLVGGNVEQTNEADGYLTKLKRAGLLTTYADRNRVNGLVQVDVWLTFTDAGIELAAQNGIELE